MESVRKKFFTLFFSAVIVLALGLTGFTNGASTAPSITWSRTYTGSGLLEVDSLLQTGDGGFLLAGTTSNGPSQPTYIELVKVDSLGNIDSPSTLQNLTPTPSVPEFPIWIVIVLFVTTMTSLLASRKKVRNF